MMPYDPSLPHHMAIFAMERSAPKQYTIELYGNRLRCARRWGLTLIR